MHETHMIAIVIPTYNERENIQYLVKKIVRYYPTAHIVVIDDNSPDGTAKYVKDLQRKYRRLHIIIRTQNKGRGASVIAGFSYCLQNFPKLSYVIEMDSDLSHNPLDIKKLLEKKRKKTIVIGSRYVPNSKIVDWPKWRLFLSKASNWYIRLLLGIPINDYTMGFRCYSKEAIQVLLKSSIKYAGFITLSETAYILHRRGFQFIEVPILLKDRTRGQSNASFSEVLYSFIAILQIRFNS